MRIDQAHKQNNKLVKIDCGATDLLNDNAALLKWTEAGHEIAEMIRSFRCNDDEDMEISHHHEDIDAFGKQFCEDVKSLCDVMRELGNLFTDTEGELLHIISKTIMAEESVDSIKNALSIGEDQYNDSISARIIKCKVPIYKKIKKNNLSLFCEKNKVPASKGKIKAVSLKEERNPYASLFVASELRDCNMDKFFKHKHHNYPPSILDYGTLRKTTKSDFLDCLQDYGSSTLTPPEFTAKVVDGTAALQSLKPVIFETFGQYASTEFYNSVLRYINEECVQRVDVVFDRFFPLS